METHLVRLIYEKNEPPRLVLRVETELRHARQEDRLERLGDLEVVGRTKRLTAQLIECEPRDLGRRERDVDLAPPDGELAVLDDTLGVGERVEELVDFGHVVRTFGVEVDF